MNFVKASLIFGAFVGTPIVSSSVHADAVADFYRGRTVFVISAGGAGGAHGLYGQVIASHIKRHIPGNPNVVMQYMLGAGGNISMNYLYNVAAKDGTYIGLPLQDLIFNARLGVQEVKYDASKVHYLGGADTTRTVVSVMRAAKVATLKDASSREVLIGTSGRSGQSYLIPVVLNSLLNTKFKPIMGYKDISEIHLAMERGEVQGTAASWPTIANTKGDWVKNDMVINLVTIGLDRDPELPNVPAITELATAPQDKDLVELLSASAQHGRAWIAMGDVPADRIAALRKAFADTMSDPAFRDETSKRNMAVNPVAWQDQEIAQQKIINTPEAAVARLKRILEL